MTTIHRGLDVMNPGGVDSGSAERAQAAAGQNAQLQPQAQGGSGSPPAEVQITSAAQLLATLEQQVSGTPELDQGRVDAIRRSLGEGSYQVDSGRVAAGWLAARQLDAQLVAGGSGANSSSVKAFAATAQLGSDPG
ncbi:MAG TPA: flagellar biosynthesis anti-sigma factor FlgM [Steroidobacteraceae bacterium]|nr:flagellar biosynthesis anti-sigma factor FlgM [Steroidobacteraceae bacterium]